MDIHSRANSYTDWGYSLCQEYNRIIAFMVIILVSLVLHISLFLQCGEGPMTVTKADIAKKIADDCGFMKNEAAEVFEKLLDIMQAGLRSARL
jgi:hypothetical protein